MNKLTMFVLAAFAAATVAIGALSAAPAAKAIGSRDPISKCIIVKYGGNYYRVC